MSKRLLIILIMLHPFKSFASDYELVGSHLLEYSFLNIDVYEVFYFRGRDGEKLVLDYKMDIEKRYSIQGWKLGLKDKMRNPDLLPKINWLFEHTVDLKKGDKLILLKNKNQLEIHKNDVLVGKTTDEVIRGIAFDPWLGDNPIDQDLKAALLGKNVGNELD